MDNATFDLQKFNDLQAFLDWASKNPQTEVVDLESCDECALSQWALECGAAEVFSRHYTIRVNDQAPPISMAPWQREIGEYIELYEDIYREENSGHCVPNMYRSWALVTSLVLQAK